MGVSLVVNVGHGGDDLAEEDPSLLLRQPVPLHCQADGQTDR